MKLNFYSDSKIIEIFKSGDDNSINKTLSSLHSKHYNMAKSIIFKNGIDINEVDSIYLESLMDLFQNIKKDKFKNESKISTYLYSIIKNKSIDQVRKQKKYKNIESIEEINAVPIIYPDKLENTELVKILENQFIKLRTVCRRILSLSFYYKLTNKEIFAKVAEISSLDSLKTQKYKCLNELKKLIKSNNELYNSLRDMI